MPRSALLTLATLALAIAAPASAQSLSGTSYEAARPVLIERGLEPVPVRHAADSFECFDGLCERFPEVLTCSGTGRAQCSFVYRSRRDGRIFVVQTRGETRQLVDRVRLATPDDLEDIRERTDIDPN
jgi:hypothetical protein